ncbi:polyadenylate-binding protein-interacting protein 4 isoform X1 [Juglans regia]|uniref:Polyadenylate-binding protein-interacting protein 4 isoform X1 n=1 Tax=Juglans regia TaxID=51240 RepID=A0A6P9EGL5_JUGRE|nr:polyadenylate-binding protein-interacting protein 4 isoform X1 [Juglans regia]
MGCRDREFLNDETSYSSSPSLSEALILATICIIGLPVDVHVKDGSVYSGLFHTSSVEDDYGIVLKNASLTKKGKSYSNVANGVLIDTLVIHSSDLVQVVAKGVQLSADVVARNMAGDHTEAVVGIVPSEHPVMEANKTTKSAIHKNKINQTRSSVRAENGFGHGLMPKISGGKHERRKSPTNQIGDALEIEDGKSDRISSAKVEEASGESDGRSNSEQDIFREKMECHREASADEVQGSTSSCDPATLPVKPDNQCCKRPSSAETSSSDAISSGLSTSSKPNVGVTSKSNLSSFTTSTEMVPQQNPESNRSSKEFKLNPGAKIFSPSLANPISMAPAVPTVASMTYIPNNSPLGPFASAQPETEFSTFASRSSMNVKVFPYGNLTAGNGVSGSRFSQPIVGPMGSRTQPLRYTGQYDPVQARPAYTHPTAQAVMVGRLGQLVYVHPVSHYFTLKDLVQGAAAISPPYVHPVLTPHQVQFQKQQGSAVGQALHLSGQQPFVMPNHIPLVQSTFPANRPISVPGANGLNGTKFS